MESPTDRDKVASPLDEERVADFLQTAVDFAEEAGEVTLRHFGGLLPFDAKRDGSPVTIADRETESVLRRRISERWPGHGILGEEMGLEREAADVRWIIDPIDGTRSFMRGVPLYGVLIGVVSRRAGPLVGVAHFPALGETVAAGRGVGCRWNGVACQVSGVTAVDRALLLTTDGERLAAGPGGAGYRALAARAEMVRTWGDCYGHILVATGRAEVMIDPVLSPWDAAPLLTILTEAGGRFTDLRGVATIEGGSGISTNGALHDAVLAAVGSPTTG